MKTVPISPSSKQSFENFIITEERRFALAASQAVAASPGKAYNPLFLYGSTGVGKTFLLHAIEHQIIAEENPLWHVYYTTTERFLDGFVKAINENKTHAFREEIQSADLLLFDDLDLMAGNEVTQKELLAIVEHFLGNQKQVVFASAKSPENLTGFSERLHSRFTWGLAAELEFSSTDEFIDKYIKSESISLTATQLGEIKDQSGRNPGEIIGQIRHMVAHQEMKENKPTYDHPSNDDLWGTILSLIKKRISRPSFDTWLAKTTAAHEGDTITIYAPNEFARDWLDSQYRTIITETIEELCGRKLSVHIEVKITEAKRTSNRGEAKENTSNDLEEIKDLLKQSLHVQKQIAAILQDNLNKRLFNT